MLDVTEFAFFDVADPHDAKRWSNWSRCYEYEWVLRKLGEWTGGRRLHNTACGTWPLHRAFAAELDKSWDVVHSDIVIDSRYDITKRCPENFDVVLSISTLEHMSAADQALALKNLTDQILSYGLLLMTFDVPPADLGLVESFFGAKCRNTATRLNGVNGPIKQVGEKFNHYLVRLAAEKPY